MLVPRDLPQVSTTTDTNFKLYDSCMPYMGMQQKLRHCGSANSIGFNDREFNQEKC
jgi:hypothetical protein